MNRRRFVRLMIVFAIGLILGLGITTAAKYLTDRIKSYYFKTMDFYFSSDLLDTANTSYQIGTWSGVGPFDISFKLFAKENELLYSESDISYTVSFNEPTDTHVSANKRAGTIYANENSTYEDEIIITVTPSRVFVEDEYVTINVTAKSTSPYKKELKASFTYVVGREGISYEIEDQANRPYLFLKITNDIDYCTVITPFGDYSLNKRLSDTIYRTLSKENQAKCVSQYITLQFNPTDLLLDSTSTVLETATKQTTTVNSISYINYIRFAIAPNSTLAIKFYKLDPTQNYKYPHGDDPCIITLTAANPVTT